MTLRSDGGRSTLGLRTSYWPSRDCWSVSGNSIKVKSIKRCRNTSPSEKRTALSSSVGFGSSDLRHIALLQIRSARSQRMLTAVQDLIPNFKALKRLTGGE